MREFPSPADAAIASLGATDKTVSAAAFRLRDKRLANLHEDVGRIHGAIGARR